MRRLSDLDLPRLLLVGLVVAVLLTVLVATSTTTTAFSSYNVAWDGTSDLRSLTEETGTQSRVIVETTPYERVDPTETAVLVLSPDTSYEAEDRQRLRQFVESGGTLVVAEDFGDQGNELLRAVGAQARFDGRLLRDEQRFYRSPNLPIADGGSNTFVSTQETTLTLNRGTAVQPNGATVAVTSSEFAYLDERVDEQFNGEPLRAHPVVTVEQVGQGRVVAVSDPSLFINSMVGQSGNRAFVQTLFEPYEMVLFDYSHSERIPPLTVVGHAAREMPSLQAAVSLLGIGAILLWLRRPSLATGLPFVGPDASTASQSRRSVTDRPRQSQQNEQGDELYVIRDSMTNGQTNDD